MAGCAIHPLPENVTGIPTHLIVAKIRCEAREAIKDNLVQWLEALPQFPADQKLGFDIAQGRPLDDFSDRLFSRPVAAIVKKFEDSAIAYDFTFDMTETNNLDATVDILRPIPVLNTFTSAFSGGVDRTRQNQRVFTVTDTFIGLLSKTKPDYCARFGTVDANYMYPITGRVGIGEMVHDFVVMSLFDGLAGDPTKKGPPTTADTLTFTTKITGSAAPKIVLAPAGSALQVADASFTASASRTDIHKLIVGLSLPAAPDPAAKKPAVTTVNGIFVTVVGTPAEISAANAVNQVYFRQGVSRSGDVIVIPAP